jgi:hypothetical protein
MDKVTANERAMMAERAWSLAKQRGDDRLSEAALADYRAARREARRGAAYASLSWEQMEEIRRDCRARVVHPEEYRSDWA